MNDSDVVLIFRWSWVSAPHYLGCFRLRPRLSAHDNHAMMPGQRLAELSRNRFESILSGLVRYPWSDDEC